MGPSWGRGWKLFRGVSLVIGAQDEEPVPIAGNRILFRDEVAGPRSPEGADCKEGLYQEQCCDSAEAFILLGVFCVMFLQRHYFFFADGLVGSVNCHLFIFCKGRRVSCFSWSVWYRSSRPLWSRGPSPSQALPYSAYFLRRPPCRSVQYFSLNKLLQSY